MLTRRKLLHSTLLGLAGSSLLACDNKSLLKSDADYSFNEDEQLLPPDKNGLMLLAGYSSRVIARSGKAPHNNSSYLWHKAPDGGATFPTDDGGWVYVSNSEIGKNNGGVGAIRFDRSGNVNQAYSILKHTNRNCAGGATPWGTWLSCEENIRGLVWECDPLGKHEARSWPLLGVFKHEAVAVDLKNNHLYLTEDERDGCLYRFVSKSVNNKGVPDLGNGVLQVAIVDSVSSSVSWALVPDPSAEKLATRFQVASSAKFDGGEGIVYYDGVISFAAKGEQRVLSYNTVNNKISVRYDAKAYSNPVIKGIDNITVLDDGRLVVCADSGVLQIVVLSDTGEIKPIVRLLGHNTSELAGPAFSPDGKRLYFSSQRGVVGKGRNGVTYEVIGDFQSI